MKSNPRLDPSLENEDTKDMQMSVRPNPYLGDRLLPALKKSHDAYNGNFSDMVTFNDGKYYILYDTDWFNTMIKCAPLAALQFLFSHGTPIYAFMRNPAAYDMIPLLNLAIKHNRRDLFEWMETQGYGPERIENAFKLFETNSWMLRRLLQIDKVRERLNKPP